MGKIIYQKLLEVQKHVNGLGKDKSTNTYKYVTGDKVLSNIKPKMNELGLILKQEVISIENTRQDYVVGISATTPNGRPKSEILSKVMMKFTWIDCETGEKDENLFGANGQNDWDKGVGSALTYAERYFLLKFFHIATDEDDIDNPDRKPQEEAAPVPPNPEPKPVPVPPTENEKKWLNMFDGKNNLTPEWQNLQKAVLSKKIKSLADVKVWYKVTPDIEVKINELLNPEK